MPTAAIILAAGASRRLGRPKQLAEIDDEPLLSRCIRTALLAGLSPVLVVLGANALEIQSGCHLEDTQVVLNEHWRKGMGSSIGAGVRALGEASEAVILMTCDQPAVTDDHLRQLIQAGEETTVAVASTYAEPGEKERRGVPGFFPRTHFPALLLLQGDTGARDLLASAKTVKLNLGEVDVDTPEALAKARALFSRSARN